MAKKDKLMDVIDFYSAQLSDLGLEVVGDGMISYKNADGDLKPVTIAGDRLCLPTRELLKEGNWDNRTVFHPLAEQFSSSLSPVMNALKGYIQVSLTQKYMQLIVALGEVASDPSRHKSLGTKISKILGEIGEMDDKTFKSIKTLVRKVMDAPETRLANLLIRNGIQEKALKVTVATHPIVEGLAEAVTAGNNVYLGTTLRKKDLEPISNLFHFVTDEGSSYESDDRTAPAYHSLMKAWLDKASSINELISSLQSKIPAVKTITKYELEWAGLLESDKTFDKFAASHHGVAPVLPGLRPTVEDEEVVDIVEEKRKNVFESDDIAKPESRRSIRDQEEEPAHSGRRSINDVVNRPTRDRGRERHVEREPARSSRRSVYSSNEREPVRGTRRQGPSINDFVSGSRGRSRPSSGGGVPW